MMHTNIIKLDGYIIKSMDSKKMLFVNSTERNINITGLKANKVYNFNIVAIYMNVSSKDKVLKIRTKIKSSDLEVKYVSVDNVTAISTVISWKSCYTFIKKLFFDIHDEKQNHSTIQNTTTTQTSYILKALMPYTNYTVKVRYFTFENSHWSAYKEALNFTTDEQEPSGAVRNITILSFIDLAIVTWKEVEKTKQNGRMLQYAITLLQNNTVIRKLNHSSMQNLTTVFKNLHPMSQYTVLIYAINRIGSGPVANCTFSTRQTAPDRPTNLSMVAISSTSIFVRWNYQEEEHKNYVLRYYILKYTVDSQYFPQLTHQVIISPNTTSTTLYHLKKFTKYNISLSAFSTVQSEAINITGQTLQDVPSMSPILEIKDQTDTTVTVSVNGIPSQFYNSLESEVKYEVSLRKPGNRSILSQKMVYPEGAPIAVFYKLEPYEDYILFVVSKNDIGPSDKFHELLFKTLESVPSGKLELIDAPTQYDDDRLKIHWKITNETYINGIYKKSLVRYRLLKKGFDEEFDLPFQEILVKGNSTILSNLQNHGIYQIEVIPYNNAGMGLQALSLQRSTCRCPPFLTANWRVHRPFVDVIHGSKMSGMFVLVKNFVESCCGECISHTTKILNLDKPSKKVDIGEADLRFPLFSNSNGKAFVNFIEKSSILLIANIDSLLADVKQTNILLTKLAYKIWLFVLGIVGVSLGAGMILAALEYNSGLFETNLKRAVLEACYCVFISMTSVGYGDYTPRRPMARCFCMIITLFGIVFYAIFVGNITSMLTENVIFQLQQQMDSKIVGSINNSLEQRFVQNKKWKGVTANSFEELYDSLIAKKLHYIVIDGYLDREKREKLSKKNLKVKKIYPTRGFSIGMQLSSRIASLTKCLRTEVMSNKAEIYRLFEAKRDLLPKEQLGLSLTFTSTELLFSMANIMELNKVLGSLLAILLLLGTAYELLYRRHRKPTPDQIYRQEIKILRQELEEFHSNMHNIRKNLREKHINELRLLIRLKEQKKKADENGPGWFARIGHWFKR